MVVLEYETIQKKPWSKAAIFAIMFPIVFVIACRAVAGFLDQVRFPMMLYRMAIPVIPCISLVVDIAAVRYVEKLQPMRRGRGLAITGVILSAVLFFMVLAAAAI